jgi:hypothetical protein
VDPDVNMMVAGASGRAASGAAPAPANAMRYTASPAAGGASQTTSRSRGSAPASARIAG